MRVFPIHAFNDNYIWCIVNEDERTCAVVDPGDANPVLDALKTHQLTLTAIFVTHHHFDHTGGIKTLCDSYTQLSVYGSAQEDTAGVNYRLNDGDTAVLPGTNMAFKILGIPGHTRGHIAFYTHGSLFCGDTLFTAGCGRVFEGTMEQMYHSLTKLSALPDNTLIYCGHEYTLSNLKFAILVEPDNKEILNRIKITSEQRQNNQATVPAPLALEKKTNPFLRCQCKEVIKAASTHCNQQLTDPVQVFRVLREWKNQLS